MVGKATNAVDGLISDRSAWGGQCVVSEARKQSATWWVDLTSVSCISHITVYYMTGKKEWGMSISFRNANHFKQSQRLTPITFLLCI